MTRLDMAIAAMRAAEAARDPAWRSVWLLKSQACAAAAIGRLVSLNEVAGWPSPEERL